MSAEDKSAFQSQDAQLLGVLDDAKSEKIQQCNNMLDSLVAQLRVMDKREP